jgi:hypothetical protein
MTTNPTQPEIVISYSPRLDLRIALKRAQGYGGISHPEYVFDVTCRLRHPTGSFTYSADDLCFEPRAFAQFSDELRQLRQGLRAEVALKSVGEMIVLRLAGDSRQFTAALAIREYLAPSMATLNASFEVDYDLFVNKLPREIDRFIDEVGQVEPAPPK